MNGHFARAALLSTAALTCASVSTSAFASAVISNGNISLGVLDLGNLGVDAPRPLGGTGVGVYDNRNGLESTYDGCVCEGWGAADAGNGTTGFANVSSGTGGVALSSFASTASTATSIVDIAGASSMQVTHLYQPSASPDLFEAIVTITNTGGAGITDLRYRRAMDWDIEPTPFSEVVTIGGVGASALLFSSDNGFASSDPLSAAGSIVGGTINANFIDSGPADHGAVFDFGFGSLAPGASKSFSIFYGASLSEAAAFAALGAVGAEVYSFGQSRDDVSGGTPGYSTFIFGFKGVGGTPVVPGGAVPEPSTWAMMIAGFGLVGAAMRRREKTARVRFAF